MTQTALIAALAKALPEIEAVTKNKDNPAFKAGGKAIKYADLTAIIEALEPIRAHGLWYRQQAHEDENGAKVETFYIHESGEQLSAGVLFMPAKSRDAQGFGSALTYCRRYGLQTAFGLATEDDDGNAATASQNRQAAPPERQDLPTGPISDVTRDWLQAQIDSTGKPVGEFCRAHGVDSLKAVTYEQMDDVKAWVRNNKEKTNA